MAYFGELSNKVAPTTLWTQYSMIRTTLTIHHNINISNYLKLKAFLKRSSSVYRPKKSKTLTGEQINKFLEEAPDHKYLLTKVTLIVGISGACRKHELCQLKIDDVTDLGSAAIIHINDTKTKTPRTFTLTGKFYAVFQSYVQLRPTNCTERRFFLNYQNQKCTRQPVGINKIGAVPKEVATFLNLETPKLYTGHCFRRSSATILVDAGGDVTTLKRHGGWRSSAIAESYIDESLENKLAVSRKIVAAIAPSTITKPAEAVVISPEPEQVVVNNRPSTTTENTQTLNLQNQQTTLGLNPINFINCYGNTININYVSDTKKQ